MIRRFLPVAAAGALLASGADAATVASYSATALSGVTLTSAHLAGTDTDATSLLLDSYWQDEWDGYEYGEGSYAISDRFNAEHSAFDYAYAVTSNGTASGPRGRTVGYVASYYTPAFLYDDEFCFDEGTCHLAPSIELTFDYYLRIDTTASVLGDGGLGHATTEAELLFGFAVVDAYGSLGGYDFQEGISATSTASSGPRSSRTSNVSEERSGTMTAVLRPGEAAGFDFYVQEMTGEAEVAPVPLPAALPMLAFGILGLGGLAVRQRARPLGGIDLYKPD